jgi:hypothetical protein
VEGEKVGMMSKEQYSVPYCGGGIAIARIQPFKHAWYNIMRYQARILPKPRKRVFHFNMKFYDTVD